MSTAVVDADSLAETAVVSIGDCATQLPLRCLQHNPAVEQRFIDEADGHRCTIVESDNIRHNAVEALALGIVRARSSPSNDSGQGREERKVERERERACLCVRVSESPTAGSFQHQPAEAEGPSIGLGSGQRYSHASSRNMVYEVNLMSVRMEETISSAVFELKGESLWRYSQTATVVP